MKHFVRSTLVITLCSFCAAQSSPFDKPIQETVTDGAAVLAAVDAAQESVFYAAPSLASESLAEHLADRAEAGVDVYVVVGGDSLNALVRSVAQAGGQIRVLENAVEGMLLIDQDVMIAGGLISGSNRETLKVETRAFGTTIVDQLRALWQAAKPIGTP